MTQADDPFQQRPIESTMRPVEPSSFPGSPWDDAGAGPAPAPGYAPTQEVAPPAYPASGYAQAPYPGYGAYGAGWRRPDEKNWMGIIALVAGLAGFVMPVLASVAAIVFGHLGRAAVRRGEATNGGMALAGLILGYVVTIGFVLFMILYIVGIVFLVANSDTAAY